MWSQVTRNLLILLVAIPFFSFAFFPSSLPFGNLGTKRRGRMKGVPRLEKASSLLCRGGITFRGIAPHAGRRDTLSEFVEAVMHRICVSYMVMGTVAAVILFEINRRALLLGSPPGLCGKGRESTPSLKKCSASERHASLIRTRAFVSRHTCTGARAATVVDGSSGGYSFRCSACTSSKRGEQARTEADPWHGD